LACYIPRWNTRPKTVTHPSSNRARRALTSFMPNAANHYATPTNCQSYIFSEREQCRRRSPVVCFTGARTGRRTVVPRNRPSTARRHSPLPAGRRPALRRRRRRRRSVLARCSFFPGPPGARAVAAERFMKR